MTEDAESDTDEQGGGVRQYGTKAGRGWGREESTNLRDRS